MGAYGNALTRAGAAVTAATLSAAVGVRAGVLGGGPVLPLAALTGVAAAAVLAGSLTRRHAPAGAGVLATAAVYVFAIWRAGGGVDAAAPLVAAALAATAELSRLAVELQPATSRRALELRLEHGGASVAAATAAAWLVLAAAGAGAGGGITLVALALAATVAALAMVVRLAGR
ncbi:MAG TPA: hypothetical protein VMU66_04590 [Gaiellales bacterium]|nr:hypothetical protein [Gaiellales bacterium]